LIYPENSALKALSAGTLVQDSGRTMNLYLLRHGSAGQRKINPIADRKRPLDKEGKQQCILLGTMLNSLKLQFDVVVSSPLKRALQTATLVGTETGFEKKIQLSEALAPTGTWRDFQRLLESVSGAEDVLLVGHSPNQPEFLNRLLYPVGGKSVLRLRKGALALVNLERGPAKLLWLIDPRVLRAAQSSTTKRSRAKTSRK
jgi:phosphohistidine phosphatase